MGALEAFYALGDGGIFQTRGKISWQYLIYGKAYAIFMATAYVLINCELGSEEPIIKQLKSLDGVREVHGTFGNNDAVNFDLIIKKMIQEYTFHQNFLQFRIL